MNKTKYSGQLLARWVFMLLKTGDMKRFHSIYPNQGAIYRIYLYTVY